MRVMPVMCMSACMAFAGSFGAQASAVEWSAPVLVPGSREAVTNTVSVSRYGVTAVAGNPGFVAVRLPEGRWLPVRRLPSVGRLVSSVDVAFDAHGRLLIAWVQASKVGLYGYRGPFQVRAQTWTEMKGWGRVKVLGRSGHFILAGLQIAVDARGDAILAWRGMRRTGRRIVESLSTSFRSSGGGWQTVQQIPSGGPYHDIALDAKGNAYAAWTTYAAHNFFAMRLHGSGRWGLPRRLPGSPASLPALAVTPGRAVVIAWRAAIVDSEGEGTQYGPVRATVRFPDGRWGPVKALSSVRVHEVHAAVSPTTGKVLLGWSAPPQATSHPIAATTYMHFSTFSTASGFSAERIAPGTPLGALAYRPNGDALVVFGQEALQAAWPGVQGPIRFSALVPREPTFSEPVTIIAHGSYPSLAGAPARGPIQAATAFYDELHKQLALSLLTANSTGQ